MGVDLELRRVAAQLVLIGGQGGKEGNAMRLVLQVFKNTANGIQLLQCLGTAIPG